MKKIRKVARIGVARNAEHYQFHYDVLSVIDQAFATAHGIGELWTGYRQLFDREDEAFMPSRTLAGTADVEAKDAARDQLMRYVCTTIAAKRFSPAAEEKQASRRLRERTEPYWRANTKSYTENTALVSIMVEALQSDEYSADTAALGLTATVEQLRAANDDFNAVYMGRSSEKELRSRTNRMREIRPLVDEAFATLAEAVNALYNVNANVTKDAAKEVALAKAIDEVNAIARQLSQTISLRLARAATS